MKNAKYVITVILCILFAVFLLVLPVAAITDANGVEATLITDKGEYASEDNLSVTLTLKNGSNAGIKNITMEIKVPEGFTFTGGDQIKTIDQLAAGDTVILGARYKTPVADNPNPPEPPVTGEAPVVLFVILAAASLGGLIVLAVKNRKFRTGLISMLVCCFMIVGAVFVGAMNVSAADGQESIIATATVKVDGKEATIQGKISYEIVVPEDNTDDPLVKTFEDLPLDGNYSYQAQGYQDSGKILLLDGESTGYSMGYRSYSIEVVSSAHTGNRALKFTKDGYDTHTTIYITLTDEQKAVLLNGGDLSFWYKSAGAATFKINDVELGAGAGDWTKVELTADMLEGAKSGTLVVYMYNTWNNAEFYIDDIVATPAVGYYVEHCCGDTVLEKEFVKAAVGTTTAAAAKEIFGFVATGSIEQTTVAEGNTTVVKVNYTRDPLMKTFEELPLDGNYSYQAQGYQDSGKILLLDGESTGYSMGYRSVGIWVVNDAHTGNAALKFKKDGYDTHSMIYITLTDEQKAVLQNGGDLSFWYKSVGAATIDVNDVVLGAGAGDWTQVTLTADMLEGAKSGTLAIKIYGTWNEAEFYIDDIVAVPAA